jgi:hypothetical protein
MSGQLVATFGGFYSSVRSLAISPSGVLVAGMPYATANGTTGNAGIVNVIEKDQSGTWNTTASLVSNDIVSSDNFGTAVTIDGDVIAVGAQGESGGIGDSSDPLQGRGAIYTFQKDPAGTWNQISKFDQPLPVAGDPNGRGFDRLGFSVALNGSVLFGGAINTVNSGVAPAPQRGTVWIYTAP